MSKQNKTADVGRLTRDSGELPPVISIRTQGYESDLRGWRRENRRVPWGCLMRDALDLYFQKNGRKAA